MQETVKAFRKIVIINLILGILIGSFVFIFFRQYTNSFLMGLFINIISFSINAFSTNFALNIGAKSQKNISVISLVLRAILVCVIALITIKENTFYIFSFMLGYTCNFISLIVYAFLI
ncbi:hypothetical protein [Clostridium sp. KNHs214]|uniref:hypothetical protein n=1 Tax=Clostridium sp. KNHs214 TaxID=1540257 RepID=UPI00054E40ED|nr:hypothetical protein [Clostridium sp. KNHs214]